MKFKFLQLLAASTAAIFLSCSDSEIQSSDVPEITQSIFIVPENYYGEPYASHYLPSDKFYVNVNAKIKICGIYAINGEYVTTDKATPYYISHKWTIDNDESTSSAVYYSFDKAGIHEVTFETLDHLGDTLSTHATIYVNTPAKVALQSPANNYNQVDGANKNGTELSWNVTGIDPWETAYCTVYASYDYESVWESTLGNLDCSESANLIGELDAIITEKGDTIDHRTEPSTIYWGVQATTKNERGHEEHAYSEVFNFSTKLKNNGEAILELPIVCQFSPFSEKSKLSGVIVSSSGDTLSSFISYTGSILIKKALQPESNIKVIVCDEGRTEFGCDSLVIDLTPNTKNIKDTLFLQDKIKPNTVPVKTDLSSSDSIQFFILDNGSGVNASKIQVILNADTLKSTFNNNIVTFANKCGKDCNLSISTEDYARNKTPDVYWKIKVNGSATQISGPFTKSVEEN